MKRRLDDTFYTLRISYPEGMLSDAEGYTVDYVMVLAGLDRTHCSLEPFESREAAREWREWFTENGGAAARNTFFAGPYRKADVIAELKEWMHL